MLTNYLNPSEITSVMRSAASNYSGVKASGTITVVTSQNGDTVWINDTPFRNITPNIPAGSDWVDAPSLAHAINTYLPSLVIASASGNIVTVVAVEAGEAGNNIRMATDAMGRIVLSGLTLTGGKNPHHIQELLNFYDVIYPPCRGACTVQEIVDHIRLNGGHSGGETWFYQGGKITTDAQQQWQKVLEAIAIVSGI